MFKCQHWWLALVVREVLWGKLVHFRPFWTRLKTFLWASLGKVKLPFRNCRVTSGRGGNPKQNFSLYLWTWKLWKWDGFVVDWRRRDSLGLGEREIFMRWLRQGGIWVTQWQVGTWEWDSVRALACQPHLWHEPIADARSNSQVLKFSCRSGMDRVGMSSGKLVHGSLVLRWQSRRGA